MNRDQAIKNISKKTGVTEDQIADLNLDDATIKDYQRQVRGTGAVACLSLTFAAAAAAVYYYTPETSAALYAISRVVVVGLGLASFETLFAAASMSGKHDVRGWLNLAMENRKKEQSAVNLPPPAP